MHIDHLEVRYLMANKDAKPRLIHWVLLLKEFNFEVIDRKGIKNQVAYHLSRLKDEAMDKFKDGSMMHSLMIEYWLYQMI